jgi:hypothetical protein
MEQQLKPLKGTKRTADEAGYQSMSHAELVARCMKQDELLKTTSHVAALPSVPVNQPEVRVNNARKRKGSSKRKGSINHGRKKDGGSGLCALKTARSAPTAS